MTSDQNNSLEKLIQEPTPEAPPNEDTLRATALEAATSKIEAMVAALRPQKESHASEDEETETRVILTKSSLLSESEEMSNKRLTQEWKKFGPYSELSEEDRPSVSDVKSFEEVNGLLAKTFPSSNRLESHTIIASNGQRVGLVDHTLGDPDKQSFSLAYVDYKEVLRKSAQERSGGITNLDELVYRASLRTGSPSSGLVDQLSAVTRKNLGLEAQLSRKGISAETQFSSDLSEADMQMAQDLNILGALARGDVEMLAEAFYEPLLSDQENTAIKLNIEGKKEIALESVRIRLKKTSETLGFGDLEDTTSLAYRAIRRLEPDKQKEILEAISQLQIREPSAQMKLMQESATRFSQELNTILIKEFESICKLSYKENLDLLPTATSFVTQIESGKINTVERLRGDIQEAANRPIIEAAGQAVRNEMSTLLNSILITPPGTKAQRERISIDNEMLIRLAEATELSDAEKTQELQKHIRLKNFAKQPYLTTRDLLAVVSDPSGSGLEIALKLGKAHTHGKLTTEEVENIYQALVVGVSTIEIFDTRGGNTDTRDNHRQLSELFGLPKAGPTDQIGKNTKRVDLLLTPIRQDSNKFATPASKVDMNKESYEFLRTLPDKFQGVNEPAVDKTPITNLTRILDIKKQLTGYAETQTQVQVQQARDPIAASLTTEITQALESQNRTFQEEEKEKSTAIESLETRISDSTESLADITRLESLLTIRDMLTTEQERHAALEGFSHRKARQQYRFKPSTDLMDLPLALASEIEEESGSVMVYEEAGTKLTELLAGYEAEIQGIEAKFKDLKEKGLNRIQAKQELEEQLATVTAQKDKLVATKTPKADVQAHERRIKMLEALTTNTGS